MTYAERFVGIDVSKARLDACLWPEGEERAFANDRQGLEANVGLSKGRFSLTGAFQAQQDNVKDDPDITK